MTLLIVGLILWIAAHYFKRLMPAQRAAMGNAGKGIVALGVVASLVLMIIGYRAADFIPVWSPPSFFGHINNLLMLVAFFVYGMSATTGSLRGKMRHPQLTAVKIWAVAHLLANGDLASIILFGGMFIWAIGSVILINRSEEWTRPAPGDPKKNILLIVITLVLYAIVSGIHIWLGVNPFGGV